MSHVTTTSIMAENIMLTNSTIVYDVVISALTSRKFQHDEKKLMSGVDMEFSPSWIY